MINTPDRKPDRETESLRIWYSTKEKEKEIIKNGFEIITKKGNKLQMIGFSTITHKKTNKILFAWKIKDNHNFLFYSPKKTEKTDKLLRQMKQNFPYFNFTDFNDILINMEFEARLLNKEKKK